MNTQPTPRTKECLEREEQSPPGKSTLMCCPTPKASPEIIQITLHRLSRLDLGIYMYAHYMHSVAIKKRRGHEFEREQGGVFEVWREEKEKGTFITSLIKFIKQLFYF